MYLFQLDFPPGERKVFKPVDGWECILLLGHVVQTQPASLSGRGICCLLFVAAALCVYLCLTHPLATQRPGPPVLSSLARPLSDISPRRDRRLSQAGPCSAAAQPVCVYLLYARTHVHRSANRTLHM